MAHNPVFFLALDGADPELLRDGITAGLLPNLAALQSESRAAVVDAPRGFGSDAIWPSVYTGVDPSRHGRYYHKQEQAGSYQAGLQRRLDLRFPTVWESVAQSGARVVIAELPKAPGPSSHQGIEVLDWQGHYTEHEFRTWPPELGETIKQRYGQPSACPCLASRYQEQDPTAALGMVEQLEATLASTRALILDLLAGEQWDLFMASIGVLHCAGHQLWHLHDPDHPWHEMIGQVGADPLMELYRRVDHVVGDILEALPPACNVVLIAGPGTGGNYVRRELLDDILVGLEGGPAGSAHGVRHVLKRLWQWVPATVRRRVAGVAHRVDGRLRATDRSGRRFYPLWTNDSVGGVRINLEGREPEGRIASELLDETCQYLARVIADIRIAGTDEPLAIDVFPTRAVYSGPHLDDLPDVLIVWNQNIPLKAIESPELGVLRQDRLPDWSGTHTGRSLAMLRMPGIAVGDLPIGASLLDIAPTIAALCGVALDGVEGQSLAPGQPAATSVAHS